MEKKLKQWIFAFFAIVITISFSSCSEDEPNYDSVDDIAGVYVGQLNMIGFSDEEAEVAYVNLSKKVIFCCELHNRIGRLECKYDPGESCCHVQRKCYYS